MHTLAEIEALPEVVSTLNDEAPLHLPLDMSFDSENKATVKAFKDQLRTIIDASLPLSETTQSAEDEEESDPRPMPANQLGQFAAGLIKGRMCSLTYHGPTGLYGLSEDGATLVFHKPRTLFETWRTQEKEKVGPKIRHAMRALISEAAKQPPVTS